MLLFTLRYLSLQVIIIHYNMDKLGIYFYMQLFLRVVVSYRNSIVFMYI